MWLRTYGTDVVSFTGTRETTKATGIWYDGNGNQQDMERGIYSHFITFPGRRKRTNRVATDTIEDRKGKMGERRGLSCNEGSNTEWELRRQRGNPTQEMAAQQSIEERAP